MSGLFLGQQVNLFWLCVDSLYAQVSKKLIYAAAVHMKLCKLTHMFSNLYNVLSLNKVTLYNVLSLNKVTLYNVLSLNKVTLYNVLSLNKVTPYNVLSLNKVTLYN